MRKVLLAQVGVVVIALGVVGWTLNERRHIAPDPNKPWMCNAIYCVQTFDASFGWRSERASCFSRRIVLRDITDDLCFSSVATCEEYRDAELKDPDFESVGGCRVVVASDEAVDAYRRHTVYSWIAGVVALLVILANGVKRIAGLGLQAGQRTDMD